MTRPKSHEDAELQRLCRERDTLRAQRDALLAALDLVCDELSELQSDSYGQADYDTPGVKAAWAAIAAVKQETE